MKHSAFGLVATLTFLLPSYGQEFQVNVDTRGDEDPWGVVASQQDMTIVWRGFEFCGSDNPTIRKLSFGGTFLSGDINVFSPSCPQSPRIAVLPTGLMCVAAYGPDANQFGVEARLLDASGVPLGPEFVVNQTTMGTQTDHDVVSFGGDRFIVAWYDVPSRQIFARVVMADGSLPYPEVQETQLPLQGAFPRLGGTPGGVVMTWVVQDPAQPNYTGVYAQRLDATATLLGSPIIVDEQMRPNSCGRAMVSGGPTGFLIAWGRGYGPSGDSDVFARLFDPVGSPTSPIVRVNTYTQGPQDLGGCAMDANGYSVVVWDSDQDPNGMEDVEGQRLDPQGNLFGNEFRVNYTWWDTQVAGPVVMLPGGDFLVTWSAYLDQNGTLNTYARRFFFPVSLLVASGPGTTNPPTIETRRPDGRSGTASVMPYGTGGFGANVGSGDVDGDGLDELLSGPGPSPAYGPHARAFRRDGSSIGKISFYAYGTLKYGVHAAGASLDSDVYDEILTAPGPGLVFGPHIRGWNFDGSILTAIGKISYYAYGTLNYGAKVSRGEIDGDAYDEILTAPGPSPAFWGNIRGWNYDGGTLAAMGKVNFYAGSNYGANVGAADIESDALGNWGDGYQEILVCDGPDPGMPARLQVYDFDGNKIAGKTGTNTVFNYKYGCQVAGGDADAGDAEEMILSPGPDPTAPALVTTWEWTPQIGTSPYIGGVSKIGTDDFTTFPGEMYGAKVAVGHFE